ncbi:MAG: hypothetical protein KME23_01375 [Goleter apudmare HA4340-LM2]|nr:hypothetical protein [Goleter apudmare HA4340-LM2]
MNRYSMIIQWSDEDQLFLVTKNPGCDRIGSRQEWKKCPMSHALSNNTLPAPQVRRVF